MIKKITEVAAHKLGKMHFQVESHRLTARLLLAQANEIERKMGELVLGFGVDPRTQIVCTDEDQAIDGQKLEFAAVYTKDGTKPVELPESPDTSHPVADVTP